MLVRRAVLIGAGAAGLVALSGPLVDVLRFLDSAICAQVPTHELYPGGRPLPLCARDTGIYTGAALAFLQLRARGRVWAARPPAPLFVATLLGLIGLMALDGANSVAVDLGLPALYAPSPALRLASGLAAGTALALLLAPVIAAALRGLGDDRAPVERWRHVGAHLLPAVVAFFVIGSLQPWTRYPVALLSNAGLLAIIGAANAILLHAIGRGRPLLSSGGGAARLYGLAGLTAVVELAVLATVRSLLLGPAIG